MRPVILRWCHSCSSTLHISTEQWAVTKRQTFADRSHCSIHHTVQMHIIEHVAQWPADTGIYLSCMLTLTPGRRCSHDCLTKYTLLSCTLSQVRKVLSQQIFRTASLETKQKTNARFRLHNISTRITWPWGLTIDASNKLWPFYDGRRYHKLVSCMNFGRISLWHCRKLSFLTCSTWSLHQPHFHYWIIHLV